MAKKIGVVRFPGSNCDYDVQSFAIAKGFEAPFLWHLNQFNILEYEALILPGGFSYGDYLRSGALAAHSPIMKSVQEYARHGGPILGICNGFQILTEAGLLPGALVKNEGRRFIDQWTDLKVVNRPHFWTKHLTKANLKLPIAHGDGRYFISPDEVSKLQDHGQIWLTYQGNPNGSMYDIAGVLNAKKNIAGLMPHPERAIFDWMGGVDGWDFL